MIGKVKLILIITVLLFPVAIGHNELQTVDNSPDELEFYSPFVSDTYLKIGYYIDSNSEYANALFPILKYNSFGLYLESFSSFSDLSQYSMIIIPFKLNWNPTEIDRVNSYISDGGLAYVTKYIPDQILDLDIVDTTDYWLRPTQELQGSEIINIAYFNYYKFFRSLKDGYFQAETPRDVSLITQLNDDMEVLHYASSDGTDKIGYISVTKAIGNGRITFSSISLFDILGQRAMGGPTLPSHTIVGTHGANAYTTQIINFMIKKQFQLENRVIPLHWHTPYAKLGVIMSRDDVDDYYEDAVETRGNVDKAHGMPTIFYELRDDIPAENWDTVLDIDSEYPQGYHIAGYHRHTSYEYTSTSYLNRVLDIEAETGFPMYFECHHGANSGFFAQDYVRTAIEATNNLNHPVVYTSSEGGHWNQYIEPYLYRYGNGSILPSDNYYSLPKSITLDKRVISELYGEVQNYINSNLFYSSDHIHFLLHSQNVINQMDTKYDSLLNLTIDKIYSYMYTDPISYVTKTLNQAVNVSASAKFQLDGMSIRFDVKNPVSGYTVNLPLGSDQKITRIALDSTELDLNDMVYRMDADGYNILFYLNMSTGEHELNIDYNNDVVVFPDDTDNDLIQDKFEDILGLSVGISDTDNDLVDDGIELFRYRSNPRSNNSDTDSLNDYDEINVYLTNPILSDTDIDGMPDDWEVENSLNPVVDDSNLDPDKDGLSNIEEYIYGSDPNISDNTRTSDTTSSSETSGTTTSETSESISTVSSIFTSDNVSGVDQSSTEETPFYVGLSAMMIIAILIRKRQARRQ